jgi:hypothetical protein
VRLNIAAHNRTGRDDTSFPQDNTRQQKNASPNPASIADPDRRRHLLPTSPIWSANAMCRGDNRNVVTDGHVVANSDVTIEVHM